MKKSLKTKIAVGILIMEVLLVVISCTLSYQVYNKNINENYKDSTENLTNTILAAADNRDVDVLSNEITSTLLKIREDYIRVFK